MALVFPVMAYIRRQADVAATRSLIHGAVAQMGTSGPAYISCLDGASRPSWAVGQTPGDSEMDGDPRRYPAGHPLRLRAPPSYTGFVAMTGFNPTCGVNDRGQVLDRWRRPLHIVYATYAYLPDGRGVWSTGPTGTGDELNSWSNGEK
jgi:hypothetical protein